MNATRAAVLTAIFATGLAAGAADAVARPNAVCPQFRRTPVARLNQLPPPLRTALGKMADPNGRWNVGDAIGPGETHLPFKHLIAAGDLGGGRWLVVWEQGGFAHFSNVDVWRVSRGQATTLVHVSGGQVAPLCAQAKAQLR